MVKAHYGNVMPMGSRKGHGLCFPHGEHARHIINKCKNGVATVVLSSRMNGSLYSEHKIPLPGGTWGSTPGVG